MGETVDSSMLPEYLSDILRSQQNGQSVVIIMDNQENPNTVHSHPDLTSLQPEIHVNINTVSRVGSTEQDLSRNPSHLANGSMDETSIVRYSAVPCDPTNVSASQPTPTGTLDCSFISVDNVIELLTTFNYSMALPCVPKGNKSNTYYVLRYDKHFGLKCGPQNVLDECGPWTPVKGLTTKSLYLVETSGTLRLLHKRDGQYCRMQKVDGKKSFVPLELQPECSSVLELIRNYSTSKRSQSFKRRITYLGSGDIIKEKVALVEYLGICPLPLKSDGNDKKRKLLRSIKQETVKKIKTLGEPSNESRQDRPNNSDQEKGKNPPTFVHPLSVGKLDSGFLPLDKLVKLLTTYSHTESLNSIPKGVKNNVYFVIKNEGNEEKRMEGKHSSFPDDCGPWKSEHGSSIKSYYVSDPNGQLRSVYKRKDVFCARYKKMGKVLFTPINPQPSEGSVLEVCRYYSRLKKDLDYKRRISWLGYGATCREKIALVEYDGVFPGLSPHGNAKQNHSQAEEVEQAVQVLSSGMEAATEKGNDYSNVADVAMEQESDISKDETTNESAPHPDSKGKLERSFLDTDMIFDILTNFNPSNCPSSIPKGIKSNVYFVLKNDENFDRRNQGKSASFLDDAGPWAMSKGTTCTGHFINMPDGQRKHITKRNNVFCACFKKNNKKVYLPLDPQPPESSIYHLVRSYCVAKKDELYKRKISYIDGRGIVPQEKLAVVEYLGIFPGNAQRGNSCIKKKRPYKSRSTTCTPTKATVFCRVHGRMFCQECAAELEKNKSEAMEAVKSKNGVKWMSKNSILIKTKTGPLYPSKKLAPVKKSSNMTGTSVCPVEGLEPVSRVSSKPQPVDIGREEESANVVMETEDDFCSDIENLNQDDHCQDDDSTQADIDGKYGSDKSVQSSSIRSWRRISPRKRKFQTSNSKTLDASLNNDVLNARKTHDYCQQLDNIVTSKVNGSKETIIETIATSKPDMELSENLSNIHSTYLENIQGSLERLTENIETKNLEDKLPEISNGALQHAVNYIEFLHKEVRTLERRITSLKKTNNQLKGNVKPP